MSTTMIFAGLLMAGTPVAAEVDVAYEEVSQGRDASAIARIDADQALENDDPAQLINLGIAFARQGETAKARTMFEAAVESSNRFELETATGDWVDSRQLARRALASLENGELSTRVASR